MQKNRVFACIVLITTILPLLLSVTVCAASIHDLPLSSLPIEGKEDMFQKISYIPEGEIIYAFDASEEMGILLITNSRLTTEHHLWHIDHSGNVIAVYAFQSPGSVGAMWDGADMCVMFVRGYVITKLDCDGTMKAWLKLTKGDYKTTDLWHGLAFRNQRDISTGSYLLQHPALNGGAKLVFVDKETGAVRVLYDVSEAADGKKWGRLIIVIGVGFASLCAIKTHLENERDKRESENKSENA